MALFAQISCAASASTCACFPEKERVRKLCVITSQLPTRDIRRLSRRWIQSLNTGMCNYWKAAETVNFGYFVKLVQSCLFFTEKHCPRAIVTFKGMLFRNY